MQIIDIIFDLPEKLKGLLDVLQSFLFQTINVFGVEVSVWLLLGGVAITIGIIYSIVRS